MLQRFHKYHGAGNDFLIADNRDGSLSLSAAQVQHLCDRHLGFGADGVMLLESVGPEGLPSDGPVPAFRMVFYNPDGSGGMMCGNGGRCIVAFAATLGLVTPGTPILFSAPDGPHDASILSAVDDTSGGSDASLRSENASTSDATVAGDTPVGEDTATLGTLRGGTGSGEGGARACSCDDFEVSGGAERSEASEPPEVSPAVRRSTCVVRLRMRDVEGITEYPGERAVFLDTGTRHLVKFVEGLEDYPVDSEGTLLRHDPRFAPEGSNVDFVEPGTGFLKIRTFEKGVEGETLACGTGIVASALAAYSQGIADSMDQDGRVSYSVRAAVSDLAVDFVPDAGGSFHDIWLTGPAAFIGMVECEI